jgi:hypothetical protein
VQTKVTVWPVQMLPLSYLTSFVSTVSVRARMHFVTARYSHGSTVHHFKLPLQHPLTLFPITLTARPPCHRHVVLVVVILPLLSYRLGFCSVHDGTQMRAQHSTRQFSPPQWFQLVSVSHTFPTSTVSAGQWQG